MNTLDYDTLKQAVAGEVAAIRVVTRLQPAGGPGDKVFPPTYATEANAQTRYAFEKRRVDGKDVNTVLLDSVPSQANRMEEALASAWEDNLLNFPVISVDFTKQPDISDLGNITTLQAPHRIADALLRDAIDSNGNRFRDTPIGKAYTDASVKNATALYAYCPTALIFGVWDSTGPRGGSGNKFQRALVSEIVGIGAVDGVKTASRIDPVGISSHVKVYHDKTDDNDWTVNEAEAKLEKNKPILFNRSGAEGKGKPSAINHSNVAPTIEKRAGGVTFDYAQQTTVLSLPALRKLRFLTTVDGQPLGENRAAAELSARTALAALALAAVAEQRRQGYDLRSRSFLVPETASPLEVELVPVEGGEGKRYSLTPEIARALLTNARAEAKPLGFGWERAPLTLAPAPKLADLIRKSREASAQSAED